MKDSKCSSEQSHSLQSNCLVNIQIGFLCMCAWPFFKMQSILASQIVHIWFRGCYCVLGHYPQQVFFFICSDFLKSARYKKQHPNSLMLPFWHEPLRERWGLCCEVLYYTFCPVWIRTDSAQSSIEQAQLCYLQWDKMEWYFFLLTAKFTSSPPE